ncbi:MAG: hypothetical protein KDE56_21915 [Anaerolineales bacterium]|nr:hypothetical protein [Anaerolineales bacterium]
MTQNIIQLPAKIYDAVCKQAKVQHKTPDMLVTEWVATHLNPDSAEKDDAETAFEQEIAAFNALKPTLLQQYPNQYVAIYQGQVVAHGNKKLEVSRQVREKFGAVVYYVAQVSSAKPRTVRIPSVWVKCQ